jgi:hypothetical protein
LLFFLGVGVNGAWAANTYDWVGGTPTAPTSWTDGRNWKISGTIQTQFNYPGANVAGDIVQIGFVAYTTNQPSITANIPKTLASLSFGAATTNSTLTLTQSLPLIITVSVTINAGTTVSILGAGTLNISGSFTNNASSTFTINGTNTVNFNGNSL